MKTPDKNNQMPDNGDTGSMPSGSSNPLPPVYQERVMRHLVYQHLLCGDYSTHQISIKYKINIEEVESIKAQIDRAINDKAEVIANRIVSERMDNITDYLYTLKRDELIKRYARLQLRMEAMETRTKKHMEYLLNENRKNLAIEWRAADERMRASDTRNATNQDLLDLLAFDEKQGRIR